MKNKQTQKKLIDYLREWISEIKEFDDIDIKYVDTYAEYGDTEVCSSSDYDEEELFQKQKEQALYYLDNGDPYDYIRHLDDYIEYNEECLDEILEYVCKLIEDL